MDLLGDTIFEAILVASKGEQTPSWTETSLHPAAQTALLRFSVSIVAHEDNLLDI